MSLKMTRRGMLKATAGASAALGMAGAGAWDAVCPPPAEASRLRMKEAMFYDKLSGRRVQCKICPKECKVGDRERGYCGTRENRKGIYYTLVHGAAAALKIDPIEKKPLFHFLPGVRAFSLGSAGCNMDCKDCQNWEISQARPEQVDYRYLPPREVARLAKENRCKAIAYTYTEPVTFYEYMHDTAIEGRKLGLRSVMISNGYINPDPMAKVAQYLDAVKVDWKGVTEEFYKKYCKATLQPVVNTINQVKKLGKWLEIVYLVVPTINDSARDIRSLAKWLKKYIGADTPVHFSRFMPAYQLTNLPPTPASTLERCHDVAREQGLNFVYLGNLPGHKYESTFCPDCHKIVISRWGYQVRYNKVKHGKCPNCKREIPGVWE